MAKIRYAANGKRDLHGLESEYDDALERLLTEEEWQFEENKLAVISYLRACKKGKVKSNGRNVGVGKSTLYRVLGLLRMLSEEWLQKSFDEATDDDWENFYDRMEEDKILSNRGKPYSQASKAKNYKTVRKFLRWKYGNDKEYPAFCDNWVTSEGRKTKGYLTRSEVEKMVTATRTLRIKTMVMMLFDGGFRIEELCNLSKKLFLLNKKNHKNNPISPTNSSLHEGAIRITCVIYGFVMR